MYLRVTMAVPTTECIYAPSRNRPGPMAVSAAVVKSTPVRGLVSFAPDGHSNPVRLNFYGAGRDCWYIRLDDAIAHGYTDTGYLLELPIVCAISQTAGFVEVER